MKELFDKFGLNEVVVYLCPGWLLLCSFSLWGKPDFARLVGDKLADNSLLVVPLMLIFAYTLGLTVSVWCDWGARSHLRYVSRNETRSGNQSLAVKLLQCFIWFFHWVPVPHMDRHLVESGLRIAEELEQYAGLHVFGLSEAPGDWLATYRVIASGKVAKERRTILKEAEAVHRRLLFALSMALVSLLFSLQALALVVALAVGSIQEPSVLMSPPKLAGAAVLGMAASFGLRSLTGRWWRQELLLTAALTL